MQSCHLIAEVGEAFAFPKAGEHLPHWRVCDHGPEIVLNHTTNSEELVLLEFIATISILRDLHDWTTGLWTQTWLHCQMIKLIHTKQTGTFGYPCCIPTSVSIKLLSPSFHGCEHDIRSFLTNRSDRWRSTKFLSECISFFQPSLLAMHKLLERVH